MRIFVTNEFMGNLRESSSKAGLYGAWVATSDFYKNLIRFGKFDEYHFFILPENSKKYPLHKEVIPYINNERVKIEKIIQLPLFLKNAKNLIFLTFSTPAIFNIANLRSIYAKRYFPICGVSHTVSYAELLGHYFFYNMISDLHPFDSIICVSKSNLESVKKIHRLIEQNIFKKMSINLNYKARLDCLPLGINSEDYMKNNKDGSRKKLRLPDKKIIILYVGRFSISDKADLYPVLFAFKNLLTKNKNILLVLAGKNFQGNYAVRLKKMANDLGILHNIKFFLNLSQAEKYLLYAASDIFVSPSDSLQESFGLTVIEAMASGLAVVVSDWDGYREIVIHNETGFCIPTYWAKCDREISNSTYLFTNDIQVEHLSLGQSVCIDIKKMIEYLSLLIKRKDLRLRLGYNARKRVLENYDWSLVIPKYEMLCDKLIDKAEKYKASPKAKPVFYPRYFECFKHYPSRILNKQTHITVTEEGIQLLKTRRFLSAVPPLNLIVPQIVFLILFYLREKQNSSIEEINEYMSKLFKQISSEEIIYHLVWMLKNYLAEVS